MVSATPRLLCHWKRDLVLILWESRGSPGLFLLGAVNLAPIRIRSPDRPARSQSLYRLSYPARHKDVLPNKSAGVVNRMNRKANGHENAVIHRLENGEHQAASCLTEILKSPECDNMGLQSATRKPRAILYGWRSNL